MISHLLILYLKTYILSSLKKILKFNTKILLGLNGIISGGISLKDFSAIVDSTPNESQEILDSFVNHDIGTKTNKIYHFEEGDKLKAAILLIENGYSIDAVSSALNWRDFEGLVAEILSSKNFAIIKNLILTKPRMEIDVIGIRLGIAMLIDCKHWKRYSSSALTTATKKQIERTRHYVSQTQGSIAVPVIVTLFQDKVNFIDKVPIVPIFQFSSFVDEFYGNLEQMKTIEY